MSRPPPVPWPGCTPQHSPHARSRLTKPPPALPRSSDKLHAIEPDPQAVLIVMEATGTYWMRLASSLVAAGFAVAVINPAQAHDFAKALLKRSKTDAIDAQTLTELGARLQPERWTPPPQVYTELQQRLVHRDGLVAARTQFRNQLHALVQQPVVIASVRTRLETLDCQLGPRRSPQLNRKLLPRSSRMRRGPPPQPVWPQSLAWAR